MSETALTTPPPQPVWQMYRALVGVGVVCGLLIVGVFQVTEPIIRANKIEARQKAIFQVLDGASSSQAFRVDDAGHFSPVAADSEGDDLVFGAFDDAGSLVGIAITGAGMGYQDIISVIYGYDPDKQAIVGFKVLESRETPGLGDKIDVDPSFLANFEALDVSLDDSRTAVAHPIEPVKHGEKDDPWEIDCITGATISSKAVSAILRESTAHWVPKLAANPQDFKAPVQAGGEGQ